MSKMDQKFGKFEALIMEIGNTMNNLRGEVNTIRERMDEHKLL